MKNQVNAFNWEAEEVALKTRMVYKVPGLPGR